MIGPYAHMPKWCWIQFVSGLAGAGVGEIISVQAYGCPPRPVPWYTWAYFGLTVVLLVISSIWGLWDNWNALWEWLAKRRAARRSKREPKP
jgi:hypothetical protein